jgi:RimJ/RimL family protein N-acetyltransferase
MDTTVVPRQITLRSGDRVLIRALLPDDGPGLAEAFEQLSETSRYRRFFTAKPGLSEQSLAYLTDVDHRDHEALVAVAPGSGQLVGVARFIRIPHEPDQAEVAVTVIDSWHRRGLGTVLLQKLARRAAQEGIRNFTADILADNQPMLTLARQLGHADTTSHGTTVSARIDLATATGQEADLSHCGYDLWRAAARGELIGLPTVLRGWLDFTEKVFVTLLVPVSALATPWCAASAAPAAEQPDEPGRHQPEVSTLAS